MMDLNTDFYELNVHLFSDNLKNLISQLNLISSSDFKRVMREKYFKEKTYFRFSARVFLLVISSLFTRRKYFLEKWLTFIDNDPIGNFRETEILKKISIKNMQESRSILTYDTLQSLNIQPGCRDDQIRKKILWGMSRYNSFEMVIAKDMWNELANKVTYQKFENGRVIALEGQISNRVYFILSGKLNLVKKFQLSGGCLYKKTGELNKGEFTDPSEVEKQAPKEYTMYSHGVTEVLILDAYDLLILRQSHHQMPLDFLNNLEFFRTYPFQNLPKREDSLYFRYFGPNQMICEDADNLPHIIVVKSGSLRIMKKIKLNEGKKKSKSKPFKETTNTTTIKSKNRVSLESYKKEEGLINSFKTLDINETENNSKNQETNEAKLNVGRAGKFLPPLKLITKTLVKHKIENLRLSLSRNKTNFQSYDFNDNNSLAESSANFSETHFSENNNKTMKNDEESQLNDKSKTESIDSFTSMPAKLTFVVVGVLKRGDIFGLHRLHEYLHPDDEMDLLNVNKKTRQKNSENERILLMSDGSEVILIGKENFVRHADTETVCKIEQIDESLYKYASESQVNDYFHKIENWKNYKQQLFNTLTTKAKKKRI